jgi:3-hydroxyisobutyrate dehydrogenase
VARPAGFEPTTPWFVARYSIQLSYGRGGANYTKKPDGYHRRKQTGRRAARHVLGFLPDFGNHSNKDIPLKIGFAGMGRMGAAMAGRLLQHGHEVTVWNRTAAKTKPLADAGAKVAATPADLASRSELIMTILTDAAAIDAMYRGKDGLLDGAVIGKLFIEMSTVRPETERALAKSINAKGALLIDCPVGGTVGPARDGKLIGFAGGATEHLARAKPVLDQLCRRVDHCGAIGAGAAMKLAINLPLSVYWQALGEALVLCKPLGLDPAKLIEIFSETSGGPNVLKSRGPSLAAALGGTPPRPVTFDIDSIRKDLRTMLEEGRALGRELPLSEKTLACYDEASRKGLGPADAVMMSVGFVEGR